MNNASPMISRSASEWPFELDKVLIRDRIYVNLGRGLLAELAAQMVLEQYPDADLARNELGEVFLWHAGAEANSYYDDMRIIISFDL